MPRLRSAAALCLGLFLAAPHAHAQSALPSQAVAVITALERVTKMPIAVLERTGDDPGQFWYRAAAILCKKTGDNWCEEDLQILTDTTNPMGWARVLTYIPRDASGNQGKVAKKVCVILPPRPGISEGYAAAGLAGGGAYTHDELTSSAETEAFLYLMHAGNCQNVNGDAKEEKRADAFAALTLTLLEGDPAFLSGADVTPARKFSTYRNRESTSWAVSVGERILIDLWKREAAEVLKTAYSCDARVVPSQNINTQGIQRDQALPAGQDCTNTMGPPRGDVTDGNLWLWTGGRGGFYGAPAAKVPLPPKPYQPFKGFATLDEAVKYAWQTAGSIAAQR